MVVGSLSENTLRYNELRKKIDGVSQRMLTLTLKELERDGIVVRKIYPTIPPKVEYSLTELGRTLIDPLQELAAWTNNHIDEIETAQVHYDSSGQIR